MIGQKQMMQGRMGPGLAQECPSGDDECRMNQLQMRQGMMGQTARRMPATLQRH